MVHLDAFDRDSQGRYTGHGKYLFKRYVNMVYGNKTTENYEDDFVRVTNEVIDTGCIGALQKTIALHAKHVYLVGSYSSFQRIIIEHFAKQHKSGAIQKVYK